MKAMFNECNELEYLDLSNFNTSNVIDMDYMVSNCYKLKNLNLENFSLNKECLNNTKMANKIPQKDCIIF